MISQHYYQCSLGKRSAQGFLLGFHGLENVKEFARGAVGALPRKIPRRSLLSKSCSKYGEEQHARASQHVPQSEIVFKGAARAKMIQNHTTRYLTSDHSIEPCAVKLCCSERPESTGDKATEKVKRVHMLRSDGEDPRQWHKMKGGIIFIDSDGRCLVHWLPLIHYA